MTKLISGGELSVCEQQRQQWPLGCLMAPDFCVYKLSVKLSEGIFVIARADQAPECCFYSLVSVTQSLRLSGSLDLRLMTP